jgi:hypothetical protein
MRLKLIILAGALLTVSGCGLTPYGERSSYYASGGPGERSFDSHDNGDRGSPVGHELREYSDQRYLN